MANVATWSENYRRAREKWELVKLLMGGTDAIRANPYDVLPQYPGETLSKYEMRVEHTTLTNVFGKTVDLMSCAPFTRPVAFDEDADERVTGVDGTGGWAQNVDRQGTDLATFAKQCLCDMLVFGKCHIYIDYPPTPGMLTLADKEDMDIRPYFRRVYPMDLFAWDVRVVGGTEVVREVRWMECRIERDGWRESKVDVIRRTLCNREDGVDVVELWEQPPATIEGEWVLVDSITQDKPPSLTTMPLVTVYANRVAPFASRPPLENLAHLNVKHLRNDSELQRLIHLTCMPFLKGKGMSRKDVEGLVIGPDKIVPLPSVESELQWVEHSGSQIGSIQSYMDGILRNMEGMALELVTKRVAGTQTATEKAINSAEQTSELAEMVRNLETGLNRAFQYAMAWEGETRAADMPIGTQINTDFGLVFRAESDIQQLISLYQGDALTLETLLGEVKARGLLADSLEPADEARKVRADLEASMPSPAFARPPGLPGPPTQPAMPPRGQ